MQNKYHLLDGTKIIIDTNFLGEGGEGGVYPVISPSKLTSNVAKILLANNRTPERRDKVEYMIKNPPAATTDKNGHSFLIWPNELLFENNQYIGFLMPLAQGVTLEELSSTELGFYPPPLHNDRLGQEWQRYGRGSNDSIILRLKLCSNIAKAVNTLHSSGHYVIGDLKPQNILVQPNGLVSIIDLDSCQITENNRVKYESKMNTPEYNPPEKAKNKKEISWDLFILGVVFYKLLCGVHPFFGKCGVPYEHCTLPELKIREGLFPFGKKKPFFEVIPIAHNTFSDLPEFVQKLFIYCFDEGSSMPDFRPTTLEWINKLTAKPSILYFKSDKDVVISTQQITLNWEAQNARTAEIEGYGNVPIKGTLKMPILDKSLFKLKVGNEFGYTEQDLTLTLFPTPVIESLKVPMPYFEKSLILNPVNIEGPTINLSINVGNINITQMQTIFVKLENSIKDTQPLYKKESTFWNLSSIFEKLKIK